jgi:hypothetical protein
MPLYRFQIDSNLTKQVVLQRIRALTREDPGVWQSIKESFAKRRESSVPFIGGVEESDFRLHRDIRYRNSFLPRIRGHVEAIAGGTRIFVTMYLHPLVGVFMLIWLGGVGLGALAVSTAGQAGTVPTLVPFFMLVFGVALTLGGFYPEAIKARRLLEQGLGVAGA